MNLEEMRVKVQTLKNEAQSFLDNNDVENAEAKTLEVKILNAQIEIQEKLEASQTEVENLKNDIASKDETIENITTELETVKNEKTEIMEKYNTATETVTELKAQVSTMKPIVDEYNENKKAEKLSNAIENYKSKFDKVGGMEIFESQEIQNLISETINEDETISNNAKYALSEKIMEIIDTQDSATLSINSIQEPSKETKNLNLDDDEFESVYGFKKEK